MREDRRHAPSRPARTGARDPGAARERRAGRPASPQPPDAAELSKLLDPVIRGAGMDLESVRVAAAGRRRLLRVVVDRDGGAGLDEIAEVSRDISARLDSTGAMGDAPYTLEVSSPGVDRPLTEPRHWRRARGRLVAVALAGARAGSVSPGRTAGARPAQQITGRIVMAGDAGVTLELDGHYREFTYAELGPGQVQVEFGKPGGDAEVTDAVPARDVGSSDGH